MRSCLERLQKQDQINKQSWCDFRLCLQLSKRLINQTTRSRLARFWQFFPLTGSTRSTLSVTIAWKCEILIRSWRTCKWDAITKAGNLPPDTGSQQDGHPWFWRCSSPCAMEMLTRDGCFKALEPLTLAWLLRWTGDWGEFHDKELSWSCVKSCQI